LALYPPGAFYAKHIDQHRGQSGRVLSWVLYLNPEWREEWGGQLRLYEPERPELPMAEIFPRAGRLVVFASDEVPHEVRPTDETRASLTGWFRR
jgi:SM-20-related protein